MVAAITWMVNLTTLNAQTAATFQTIALTGMHAPESDPNEMFSRFYTPHINSIGKVSFRAFIRDSNMEARGDGIWSNSMGPLELIARRGEVVQTSGGTLTLNPSFSLGNPRLNAAGHTSFFAAYGTGITNNRVILSVKDDSIEMLARTGAPATQTEPGTRYGNISRFFLNDEGTFYLAASLTGSEVTSENGTGIWLNNQLIIRTGDSVHDASPGTFYGRIETGTTRFNQNDGFAFYGAQSRYSGIHTTPIFHTDGIWAGDSESLRRVVKQGDLAPGTENGVKFTAFDSSAYGINDSGQVMFTAKLNSLSNNWGIWVEKDNSLELIVRQLDPVPGADEGVEFRRLDLATVYFNNNGQVAFHSGLGGPGTNSSNNAGLWYEDNGSLKLVAREGDHAHGTNQNVVYDDISERFFINDTGHIAFMSSLTGLTVDDSNDHGLWVKQPNGVVSLVIREGDLIDVNNDPLVNDIREVESLFAPSINNAGQLPMNIGFTDGSSGIFIATIPEPTSIMLFAAAIGIFYRRGH